jgi:hypothetical protein
VKEGLRVLEGLGRPFTGDEILGAALGGRVTVLDVGASASADGSGGGTEAPLSPGSATKETDGGPPSSGPGGDDPGLRIRGLGPRWPETGETALP